MWSTDRMHPLRIFADPYGDVGCIDYHPNCNYIAGGSDDRYVRVWDVCSGTRVRIFSGHKASIIAVKFSPCGRYIVSLDAIGNLMIWDLAYQRLVAAEITEQAGTKVVKYKNDNIILLVHFRVQLHSLVMVVYLRYPMEIQVFNYIHLILLLEQFSPLDKMIPTLSQSKF